MTFKKSIYYVSSILATSSVFAVENDMNAQKSKINLDVLGGIGFTHYSDFKDANQSTSDTMNGFNVNAGALYSILKTDIGSPVVGMGLNYNRLSKDIDGVDLTSSTVAAMANAGFKFVPTPKLAIFTLGNFGYGFYNSLEAKNSDGSLEFSLDKHFIYGASLIGTYEVAPNLSVGAGFTFNKHSFNVNSFTAKFNGISITHDTDSSGSINEYSANLMVSYSL